MSSATGSSLLCSTTPPQPGCSKRTSLVAPPFGSSFLCSATPPSPGASQPISDKHVAFMPSPLSSLFDIGSPAPDSPPFTRGYGPESGLIDLFPLPSAQSPSRQSPPRETTPAGWAEAGTVAPTVPLVQGQPPQEQRLPLEMPKGAPPSSSSSSSSSASSSSSTTISTAPPTTATTTAPTTTAAPPTSSVQTSIEYWLADTHLAQYVSAEVQARIAIKTQAFATDDDPKAEEVRVAFLAFAKNIINTIVKQAVGGAMNKLVTFLTGDGGKQMAPAHAQVFRLVGNEKHADFFDGSPATVRVTFSNIDAQDHVCGTPTHFYFNDRNRSIALGIRSVITMVPWVQRMIEHDMASSSSSSSSSSSTTTTTTTTATATATTDANLRTKGIDIKTLLARIEQPRYVTRLRDFIQLARVVLMYFERLSGVAPEHPQQQPQQQQHH